MGNNLLLSGAGLRALAITSLSLSLLACGGGKGEQAPVSPSVSTAQSAPVGASKLCVFSDDDGTSKCQAGQIALFVPKSWGNEQFPIIYAAKYCDFNFPVVHTNGAVSCVFFKGRTFVKNDEPSVSASPAPATAPKQK